MNSAEISVEVRNVSMSFKLPAQKIGSLKEYCIKRLSGSINYREFWALKDVSMKIKRGEAWAFVGSNGSGKSTLLKIIAGIYKPTNGEVSTHGSIAPLINLGAGFDPELTARENIYLNGAVLGYHKKFIESKFDEIVDFSELDSFIDVPVKNFSSGMHARLGFSIATVVKPEILIVDEILAVGDFEFRKKCDKRIHEMLDGGTTLLLVSHSSDQVKKLCKNALLLSHGSVVMQGTVEDVCEAYEGENNL